MIREQTETFFQNIRISQLEKVLVPHVCMGYNEIQRS